MSTEVNNGPKDLFNLFENSVLLDSKECDLSFLNGKRIPNEETRETDFTKLENRLAYLYRFGNFNVHTSKKCFTNFLENYSEASLLFFKNDLKIYSLTNGPGLDLIGLFLSIFKSNICLKNVPDIKIIALYNTWWSTIHRLFTEYYEVIRSCFETSIKEPQIKVDGLINDIYSDLSVEAKDCLGDTDILLMFKVFYSSKATPEKTLSCMKEIVSLLKPGSCVFFLGSKTNTKELAENTELQCLVDCILGPIKISVDLPGEDVIKPAALQPRKSGHGYFLVWKKKGDVLQEQTKPKKKKTKKNKLKNGTVAGNDAANDSIDSQSELYFNFCSEQSESFINGSKSASYENLSTSGVQTKSKGKGLRKEVLKNLFCNSLNNLSDNSDTDSKTPFKNKHFDELQNVSKAKLFRSHSLMELNKKNLAKKHLNSSLSDFSQSVNNITSLFDKMQIKPSKARSKSACSLDGSCKGKKEGKPVAEKKDFNPAKFQDDLLRNLENTQKPKVENTSSEISPEESKETKKSKKNKNQNMINENSSVLSESINENKILSNSRQECLSMEDKSLTNCHESKQDFSSLLQAKLKTQNISSEITEVKIKENKLSKKNKNIVNEKSMLSGLGPENEVDNTLNSRISVENEMQSNLVQFTKSMCCIEEKASNRSVESKQDFKSLLQRCESLVTSLEKFTHSIERNITLRNKCNISGSCAESKPLSVCATSCPVHFDCRKRTCNCHTCPKCHCTSCTKIISCEASRPDALECSAAVVPKGVPNTSTPYIVMPITKEDILHILTSKKS